MRRLIAVPHFLIAIAASQSIFISACYAQSGNDNAQWTDRFLREGPAGWEEWRQFNRHLEGVVRVTEAGTVTNPSFKLPPKPRETIEWRFKFNGDWALQEQRVIETTDHGTPEIPRPARGAIAISSKYGFSVKQETEGSAWLIRGVVTKNYENLRESIEEGAQIYIEAPWVFFYGYFPLPTLIRERGFKLNKCEPVLVDGHEHCKVFFEYAPTKEKPEWKVSMRGAWLLLAPDNHWAIKAWEIPEYAFATSKGKQIREIVKGENAYGDVSHGFGLLRETQQRAGGADGYVDTNVVFTKLAYRDSIPEAEFGLAQYGLPEPYGPLASGKSMRGPILILAGLVAIVVAGLLYYRVRNARAALK